MYSNNRSKSQRPKMSYTRRMMNSLSSSQSFPSDQRGHTMPADSQPTLKEHDQRAAPTQVQRNQHQRSSLYSDASKSVPRGIPPKGPGQRGARSKAFMASAKAVASDSLGQGGSDEEAYFKARFNGVLYLSNRNLNAVPDQVITIFDPKWRRPEERWWEQVPAVQKLDLSHNHIVSLPPELASMAVGLETLLLKGNQLRDCAPVALLRQLRFLNLSNNQLQMVPDLSGIIDLMHLDVSSNNLDQLPGLPGSLVRLDCGQNKLRSLGTEFQNLSHLRELHASNNRLSNAAAALGHWCQDLQIVDVSNNELEDLPESIVELQDLQLLDARGNQLCIFPLLPDRSPLKELRLSGNELPEVDDRELGKVASTLVIFDIATNFLEDLPGHIFRGMNALQHLDVSNNRISELPSSIGLLKSLRSLKIDGNMIRDGRLREALEAGVQQAKDYLVSRIPAQQNHHQIPGGGENNSQLQVAPREMQYYHPSHAEGPASQRPEAAPSTDFGPEHTHPEAEVYCQKIVVIPAPEPSNFLGQRNNGGQSDVLKTMPSALFLPRTCATLEQLSISKHSIKTLPPQLSRLSSLRVLKIDSNKIKALPIEILLMHLTSLELQGNALGTDGAFDAFGDRSIPPNPLERSLETLDLGGNRLSTLPVDFLKRFSKLKVLRLGHNKLERFLDLRNNQTSGEREDSPWCFFPNLLTLDVGDNDLRRVPKVILRLPKLQHLNIQNNMIRDLPNELGLCAGLQSLRVTGNPQTRIRPEICNRGTKGLISYLHGRLPFHEQEKLKRERDVAVATYVEFRAQTQPGLKPEPQTHAQYPNHARSNAQSSPSHLQRPAHGATRRFDLGRHTVGPTNPAESPHARRHVAVDREITQFPEALDRDTVVEKLEYIRDVTGESMAEAQLLLLQAQGNPDVAVKLHRSRVEQQELETAPVDVAFAVSNSGHAAPAADAGFEARFGSTGHQNSSPVRPPVPARYDNDNYNNSVEDPDFFQDDGARGLPPAVHSDWGGGHTFGATVQRDVPSSNRFASGAHQNSGNVLTERPSTRVQAPPGGFSQISFGGDQPQRRGVGPNLNDYAAKMEAALAMANVQGARAAVAEPRRPNKPRGSRTFLRPTAASKAKQTRAEQRDNTEDPREESNRARTKSERRQQASKSAAQPDFSVRRTSWGGGPSTISFGDDSPTPSHHPKSNSAATQAAPAQRTTAARRGGNGHNVKFAPPVKTAPASSDQNVSEARSPLSDRSWGGGRTSIQIVGSGMLNQEPPRQTSKTGRGRKKLADTRRTRNGTQPTERATHQAPVASRKAQDRSALEAVRSEAFHDAAREAAIAQEAQAASVGDDNGPSRARAPPSMRRPTNRRGHAALKKHHSWGGGPSSFSSVGDFAGSGSALSERDAVSTQDGRHGRYHDLCDEIQMLETKIGGIGVRLPDHKRHELKKSLANKRATLRRMVGK